MKTLLKSTLYMTCALGLSACGGLSNIIDELEDDEFQDAAPADAPQSHVAGLKLNYDADVARSGGGQTLKFKKNDDGTYGATLNGKTYSFSDSDRVTEASDGKVYSMQNDDEANNFYSSIWHQSGELDELTTNGDGYVNVIGMQVFDETVDSVDNSRIFAVVGDQTATSQLPVAAEVTYSGSAQIQAFPKAGFVNIGDSRSRYRGDLALNANFAAAKVGGSISNLTEQLPGSSDRNSISGTVLLNQTDIASGSFAGNVGISGTAAFDTIDAGSYSGSFYGPNASNAGGVITLEGDDAVANGYFIGAKN